MKYKKRVLSKTIQRAIKTFPAIVVTGPRQSGKTTLYKMLFSNTHNFVSLENPDIRVRAKEDPVSFLNQYRPPVIIDKIQYLPELLSYIKTEIDSDRKPGNWLFTGSQNFILMDNISQSLAGRIATLSLLPFSISELLNNAKNAKDYTNWLSNKKNNSIVNNNLPFSELILRGFYPEISANKKVDRKLWCSSYITTYLERDIRSLTSIGDLSQFERFLIACAVRTGQILNLSDLARNIGISVPTAKRWLSLLETGHQIYLLYPYYKNIGKRIIKSPKIYFCDTAICSYLLGIHNRESLLGSPYLGNLFETMIVIDFLKRFLHFGDKPNMYYLRTRDGLEIDLVIEVAGYLYLYEIKSTMTILPKHAVSLKRMVNEFGSKVKEACIISRSNENFMVLKPIFNYSWKNILYI
ncbi:MAG: ATP-binding protein [Atribacterota bacterium]|nr:ATP-binding protein [Atribacterota bacterium]